MAAEGRTAGGEARRFLVIGQATRALAAEKSAAGEGGELEKGKLPSEKEDRTRRRRRTENKKRRAGAVHVHRYTM